MIGASQALLGSKRPRSKQFSGQPPPELHGPARVIGASQALPGGKRLSSKPGSQCRKQHKGQPAAAKARAASHALPGDKRPLLGPASRWPQQPSSPPPLKLRATKKLALKAKPPPVLEVKTKPPPVLPLSAKPPPVLQRKAKELGAPSSARPAAVVASQLLAGGCGNEEDRRRGIAAEQRASAKAAGWTASDSHRLWLDKKYKKRTAKRLAEATRQLTGAKLC